MSNSYNFALPKTETVSAPPVSNGSSSNANSSNTHSQELPGWIWVVIILGIIILIALIGFSIWMIVKRDKVSTKTSSKVRKLPNYPVTIATNRV